MTEQAVIAHLSLSGGEFGEGSEREEVRALEQSIERVLDASGGGELDGNEFGGGEAILYMYGPDAGLLFSAVEPVLRRSHTASGLCDSASWGCGRPGGARAPHRSLSVLRDPILGRLAGGPRAVLKALAIVGYGR